VIKKQWAYYDEWLIKSEKFNKVHYKLVDTDLSKIDDKELMGWIKKYYRAFTDQYSANNFIEPLSFYFQNHLHDLLLKSGISEEKAKELAGIYGSPAKPNYIKQSTQEYKESKSDKDKEEILKKYHYINNDYTGSRIVTKKDLEELAAKNSNHLNQQTSFDRVPKGGQNLLTVLQITATIQDVRKAESLMWITGAEKLVNELAKRKNIPVEKLLFATWEEVIDEKFDIEELEQRQKCCVVHWQPKEVNIYSGDNAAKITNDFKETVIGNSEEIKEFKGVSASKGKVKGRAVVVLNVSQFNKVKEGDILVTVMTRPEYLPVMQLASAFVTDEGGITSHAAIVAREMKKPCVIATKIASKVIKDGDILEVDADNGIVRKI
jgi:phosphoenolpyruvate synthase/pyruvate phosphate dikinase